MSNNILSNTPIASLCSSTTLPYIHNYTTNTNGTIANNTSSGSVSLVTQEDLDKRLSTIEKRLAILVPDPLKLQKYETLRKAYEHYKMLEILLEEQNG
jgi:hypothetical protein